MHTKRMISIAVAALGVVATAYAISSMGKISDAKGKVSSFNKMTSGSSGGRMAGKYLSDEASQYDTKVRLLLIGGIVFIVAGCYGVYRYRRG